MTKEEMTKKTIEVINDPSSSSNSELTLALEIINKDYETTKDTIIKLTYHLDSLEETYNKVLKEYNKRNGGK
jgi:hypothetical protein